MIHIAHWTARSLIPESLQPAIRRLRYRRLIRNLDLEPDAIACRQYVRPGDTVLDVGANIGVYTRPLAEYAGMMGTVHVLEPVLETFEYLVSNIQALQLHNVICYNIAASDRNGMARMTIPSWSGGGKNIYRSYISKGGDVSVRTMTLDSLFPDLSPSFVKCDVEGHEIEVIEGSRDLIRRCRPVWLLEVNRDATIHLMWSLGYVAQPATRPNWFFLPAS